MERVALPLRVLHVVVIVRVLELSEDRIGEWDRITVRAEVRVVCREEHEQRALTSGLRVEAQERRVRRLEHAGGARGRSERADREHEAEEARLLCTEELIGQPGVRVGELAHQRHGEGRRGRRAMCVERALDLVLEQRRETTACLGRGDQDRQAAALLQRRDLAVALLFGHEANAPFRERREHGRRRAVWRC